MTSTGLTMTHPRIVPEPPPQKIGSIKFEVDSSPQIANCSALQVVERNLYKQGTRQKTPNGLLDTRLGTTSKNGECQTCGGDLPSCAGHFGFTRLELPVFHIGFIGSTINALQSVCKRCSRIMLPPGTTNRLVRDIIRSGGERKKKQAVTASSALDEGKRRATCPHCFAFNGTVKKAGGAIKIIHDKAGCMRTRGRSDEREDESNESQTEEITPLLAYDILASIPEREAMLLNIEGRPESLILRNVSVPPVCIRPSVELEAEGGSNEDDLTMLLVAILDANMNLRKAMEKGSTTERTRGLWDVLQEKCAMYINSELPGVTQTLENAAKPKKGVVQRLKGKEGRFRQHLSGKRVDFSGRTVISPDPDIAVEEVGIPESIASNLTFPESVNDANVGFLRQCVLNGTHKRPGANFVEKRANNTRLYLKYANRQKVAMGLKEGDIVERHLIDRDVVLFNRQPSLHRVSIMAHRARILPGRTFRLNECACSPYNADFDGDEMNMHVPQRLEAKSEASELMGVESNLKTPKNGDMLVSATQDFLTSAFLMTRKDSFFDRAQVGMIASHMGDGRLRVSLPPPAVIKPDELWTGKQMFAILLRPNEHSPVDVNLNVKERFYSGRNAEMCSNDGCVVFRQSKLMCGALGKTTLGEGKSSVFFQLQAQHSAHEAAVVMSRLAKLSSRWLGTRGFSMGIDDVTPSQRLKSVKEETVRRGYKECGDLISKHKRGKLPLHPGCGSKETLEAELTGKLSAIREEVGRLCVNELPRSNSPHIMAQCGAKGSPINIAQMVACVGQQAVNGGRIESSSGERALPHFDMGDEGPQAKGFVASSFFSGLSPTEFFFHTMAGREGLVDTAVKTAETGYMSRRLMKSMEDLWASYDGTVRDARNGIMQMRYGDDGIDPMKTEGKNGMPFDLEVISRAAQGQTAHRHTNSDSERMSPEEAEELALSILNGRGNDNDNNKGGSKEDKEESTTPVKREIVDAIRQAGKEKGGDLRREPVERAVEKAEWELECKQMQPGTAVGALAAQSIGEPGTQMTLRTFHFAGVASMNVTQGVPRLKEIINASKDISTPIMNVTLKSHCNHFDGALGIKSRLEKTKLGEISKRMELVLSPVSTYIEIEVDFGIFDELKLPPLSTESIATSLSHARGLNVSSATVKAHDESTLRVTLDDAGNSVTPPSHKQPPLTPTSTLDNNSDTEGDQADKRETNRRHKNNTATRNRLFKLGDILRAIPEMVVSGVPSIKRAVVQSQGEGGHKVVAEGKGLINALGVEGVEESSTSTNNCIEVANTLGIEAGRASIEKEIETTMKSHGMSVDPRHIGLLSDVMTHTGAVLGITRFGLKKIKASALMLASFEKTSDHLFEAALRGEVDAARGVSESIILGRPLPLGTGCFSLLHSPSGVSR